MRIPRLKYLAALKPKDLEARTALAFRNVAKTTDGAIVFATILQNLRLLEPATSPAEEALCNYAKQLVKYFGEDAQFRVLDALLGGQE